MKYQSTMFALWVLALSAVLTALLLVSEERSAYALEDRLGFGADLGFWADTSDDEVFAMGFNLDYYVDRAFSIGPMVLFSPSGDLTQVAFAPVARFHIRLNAVNIVPLAGAGFIHGDLERKNIDESDTSFYIPLGVAAEYPLGRKLALATTLYVNLHDLELEPRDDDNVSVALMFGLRFGP